MWLLLALEGSLLVKLLCQVIDVVAACGSVVWGARPWLGVDRLVQVTELQGVLRLDQLLCACGGRVESIVVVLLVGLGRRRILGHLR